MIWQEVVRKLSRAADAVVVDISEPSENLLWEIETLKEIRTVNCVYVGQLRKVLDLNERRPPAQRHEDVDARLKKLLENEKVLVYESEPKGAMRVFADDLAAYLDPIVA